MGVCLLGRLVARRTTTPAGTRHRAYLHDGDQVVEEYASAPGHTGVLLARRHHWGRWIDDLVADEADTDGDGTLETTLYPVTDLLGSVELLTDAEGRIVERIAYDPDGTPHFWGEDTVRPRVTQLAWTGTGASPTGVTVAARTLVLRFSEAIHQASMTGMILTLTPEAGNHTQALDGDGRTLRVSFEPPIPAATPTTLHLDGLRDRTGNTILPFDTTFTLTDSQAYAVLADTAAPQLHAVIDTAAGLVLTFDEPVQPPQGTPLAGALTLTRSGLPVGGTTTRLSETALAWTPAEPASWQPGGEYKVTALTLQDLHSQPTPVQTAPLPLIVTHLATQPADAILAYSAPTDSTPLANSQYGQTALFQGREWHADLGMYHYRARWYAPTLGTFLQADPVPIGNSPGLYSAFSWSPVTLIDPLGESPSSPLPAPLPTPTPREPSRRGSDAFRPTPVPTPRPMGSASPRRSLTARVVALADGLRHELLSTVDSVTWNDDYVSQLLNLAERHYGMSGITVEGMAVASVVGVHGGVNAEIFYREGSPLYTVGLFVLETPSHVKEYLRQQYKLKPWQQWAGLLGAHGLALGTSVGVNLAVADGPEFNNPANWEGFFDTFSGSFGPFGVSVFLSEHIVGVELSGGVGPLPVNLTYTRPNTHEIASFEADREGVKAFYRLWFQYGGVIP